MRNYADTNKRETHNKLRITDDFIIAAEKAARLRVKTGIEERVFQDIMLIIQRFSMSAVVTEIQFDTISNMAERYDQIIYGEEDEDATA